jgi:hypothetical protein
MSNGNEAIVKRFIDSKAVDFTAIGKLVSGMGPELATTDFGAKFVLVGRHFIIACMMPPAEAAGLVGKISGEVGAAMKE